MITKNTTISNILIENPEQSQILTEIMLDFGIHCVGCGAASIETLEQGVLGHGYTEKDLNKLIKDLNKVIKEASKKPKKQTQEFNLNLTEKAIEKIKESIKQSGKETLKISVVAGGCSGFMYDLEMVDSSKPSDLNIKQGGISLVIDPKSMELLSGTEIDYVDTLNESGFKFNNPNADHGCGCGKSFG